MREGQCQIRFDVFLFGFMSRGKEGENYIISFFIDIIYLFLRESVYIETCVGREWSALNDIADSETALDTDADEYKESNLQAQEKQGGGRAFLLLGSCNFYRVSYQNKNKKCISYYTYLLYHGNWKSNTTLLKTNFKN